MVDHLLDHHHMDIEANNEDLRDYFDFGRVVLRARKITVSPKPKPKLKMKSRRLKTKKKQKGGSG